MEKLPNATLFGCLNSFAPFTWESSLRVNSKAQKTHVGVQGGQIFLCENATFDIPYLGFRTNKKDKDVDV